MCKKQKDTILGPRLRRKIVNAASEIGVILWFAPEATNSDPALRGEHLTRLRIIVADDNPAFLRELTSLLAVEFEVVATATDGNSALDLTRRYKPDLVVLDLGMPALNGIEVSRELAKSSSSPPVVICSVETDSEIMQAARQAGALGYVFKIRVHKDLILAMKSALRGKSFVSPNSIQ
jgi:DNA-binding NarL/FixJ family response regulator